YSGGDARKLINSVEWVLNQYKGSGQNQLSSETILKVLQETIPVYDKNGEQHYDVISAFIKSIRGSDVNAALYWLGRMLV
ncbi:replication-associated recombination protein A, partial [Escherichia coli]|nr:replication-associated recombination protein A [Escherichia coli]